MEITISISDAAEKALLYTLNSDVESPITVKQWLTGEIDRIIQSSVNQLCREILKDKSHTLLAAEEKQNLVSAMAAENVYLTTIEDMPAGVKEYMISKAKLPIQSSLNKIPLE